MVKLLKLKIVPVLVSVVLALSPLALSVNAAVWEGGVNLRVDYWGSDNGIHYAMSEGTYSIPISSNLSVLGPKGDQTTNGLYFYEGFETWSQPVDVYMSGYLAGHPNYIASETVSIYGNPYDRSNYEVTYRGTHGGDGEVVSNALVELTPFTPNETLKHGGGISIRAGWAADEVNPISHLKIRPKNECGWKIGNSPNVNNQWVVTSVRLISSETSAELDELSNVANQIIEGNEILEAMKGDVVALLQQIYTQTGDIEIAVTQTNTLLNSLLGFVDGLEGQLTNIYSTLSSFVTQLLRMLQLNNQLLLDALNSNHSQLMTILRQIQSLIDEGDGAISEDVNEMEGVADGTLGGLNELEKPDFSGEDLEVDGYSPDGNVDYLGNVLAPIFSNSLFFSMLMVTMTFCLVAYVLYGKR